MMKHHLPKAVYVCAIAAMSVSAFFAGAGYTYLADLRQTRETASLITLVPVNALSQIRVEHRGDI